MTTGTAKRPHTRCWYCGARDLCLTTEHVLAEKHFGGRLRSPGSVCAPCNSLAGKIEGLAAEHPFVSEAIAQFRTYKGGKRFPKSQAVLPDDARATVEPRPDGPHIVGYEPRQIDTDPDGTEVWEVAAGQEAEFELRRRRRGDRVRAAGRPLGPGGYMQLSYGIGTHNFAAWPRFVAKVALSTASLVTDERWLDTDGALVLQDMFHERCRPGGAPYELPSFPEEHAHSLPSGSDLPAGAHVLGIWRDEQGTSCRFGLALFGYLVAVAELRDLDWPSDERTWIVPSNGPCEPPLSRAQFRDLLAQRDAAARERARFS